MKIENFIKKEQARAELYNLLSALFAQPEDAFLHKPELVKSLHHWLDKLNLDGEGFAKKMEQSLNDYTEEQLLIEYAHLFVGPFKIQAPPYSSVYLGDGTVMNKHSVWVLQQYREAGIDFNFEVHDLPDHIAVENSFLYYLTYNEIKALQNGDVTQAKLFFNTHHQFLKKHYRNWVPQFCLKGKNNTQNKFYQIVFAMQEEVARLNHSLNFPG